MPAVYLWHLWPGRHWPATPGDEATFVADLRTHADGRIGTPDRPSITCVLNALRSGTTYAELTEFLPGIDAADLLAGYELVEARRAASEQAWWKLCGNPVAGALAEVAADIALLLPVPVRRLSRTAATVPGPAAFTDAVLAAAAQVTTLAAASAAIERVLAKRVAPDDAGVLLGAQLHNPRTPALWGDPYFLPRRVGSLSPPRVADLLGERAP